MEAAAGIGITIFTILIIACSALLPIIIMALTFFLIYKRIKSGGGVVIQSSIPGVAEAIADAAGATAVTVGGVAQQSGPRQLKRVTCRTCGASKLTPPKTAYMYCDYCGTLADWDFRIACEQGGSAQPGPKYEQLNRQLAPKLGEALASGDRETYLNLQKQLFDAHMTACPASYSPRLGDPEYRSQLLDYTALCYSTAAFDPECKQLENGMQMAMGGLQWTGGMGSQRLVEPTSFRRLIDAFKAHNARFLDLSRVHLEMHPDHPPEEMLTQIGASAFIQGWLPYLNQQQQDELIAEFGLSGEYVSAEPPQGTERPCQGCGTTLTVPQGARRTVCESCGHTNDWTRAQIPCTNCGTPILVPPGQTRFSCPSCGADMRLDGATPG